MSSPLKLLNNCRYFDVVAWGLSEALTAQDPPVPHEVVTRVSCAESTYVVFTTHHLHEALPARYIAYNFEQLTTDRAWPAAFFDRLRGAVAVWDYSLENARVLRERHGIADVVHLPFGFSPCMLPCRGTRAWTARPCDWLHVGALSERRRAALAPLLSACSVNPERAMVTNSCWGALLDDARTKTRVGVNLHFYGGSTILEVHRIVPLVAARALVITERSDDPWYDAALAGAVTFLPPSRGDELGATLLEAVSSALDSGPDIDIELERRFEAMVAALSYSDIVRQRRGLLGV